MADSFDINRDGPLARVEAQLAVNAEARRLAVAETDGIVDEHEDPVETTGEGFASAPLPQTDYYVVDDIGLKLAVGLDAAFILMDFSMVVSGTADMPDVPIIRFKLKSGPAPEGMTGWRKTAWKSLNAGFVYRNLTPQQRDLNASLMLGTGYTDLVLNRVIAPSFLPIGDSSYTNTDVDPDNEFIDFVYGMSGNHMADEQTGGTVLLITHELDKLTSPAHARFLGHDMLLLNSDKTGVRIANLGYFGAHLLMSAPHINYIVRSLEQSEISIDDYRVDYFIKETGGYPDGVDTDEEKQEYEQYVAALITDYQGGGDNVTHQVTFAYFRELGIDLSDEDDPMAALMVGAAQGAEKVSPSGSFLAVFLAINALAAGQEFNLGTTSALGFQSNMRALVDNPYKGNDQLLKDGVSLGTAVFLGGAQVLAVKAMDGDVETITLLAIGAQQTVGFIGARAAEGDQKLLIAIDKSASQLGAAVGEPLAIANLTYATDYNYIVEDDGDDVIYKPNATTSGMTMAVMIIGDGNNVLTGLPAGGYMRRGVLDCRENHKLFSRYFWPVIFEGVATGLEMGMYSYYSSKNTLPEGFRQDYQAMLDEADSDFEFAGNDNNGALLVPALTSAGTTGLSVAGGYLLEQFVFEPVRDRQATEAKVNTLEAFDLQEAKRGLDQVMARSDLAVLQAEREMVIREQMRLDPDFDPTTLPPITDLMSTQDEYEAARLAVVDAETRVAMADFRSGTEKAFDWAANNVSLTSGPTSQQGVSFGMGVRVALPGKKN